MPNALERCCFIGPIKSAMVADSWQPLSKGLIFFAKAAFQVKGLMELCLISPLHLSNSIQFKFVSRSRSFAWNICPYRSCAEQNNQKHVQIFRGECHVNLIIFCSSDSQWITIVEYILWCRRKKRRFISSLFKNQFINNSCRYKRNANNA